MTESWTYRDPTPEDISYIYSTFLNSYHYDSWTKSIKKTIFFDNYKLVIDRLLHDAKVTIACRPNNPNFILGYIIYDSPDTIHYIFIRESVRKFGIAKDLVDQSIKTKKIYCTHRTKTVLPIFNKNENLIFNPFILYKKVEDNE